jgi:hypothetical protein
VIDFLLMFVKRVHNIAETGTKTLLSFDHKAYLTSTFVFDLLNI